MIIFDELGKQNADLKVERKTYPAASNREKMN